MIINRLTMHNFGLYAGTNTFEFTSKKPIVLIGGMNGRGKTTFLEAILLSLYGANSIAYKESDYNSYNQYLRSYVNNNSWSQSSYVEIEFLLNESSNDTYLVRREWNALSRITKEEISVQQNGVYSEFLTQNWAMFVENILPSALSSFYFFDGEKIAELAVAKTDDQMKASIRSMLGMTILDVLKNDLGRIVKKINRNNKADESNKHLETLREERDQAISELEKIDESISIAIKKVENLQEEIEQLHKKYELQGGAVLEQRQSLMQKRAQIQTEIVQNAERLVGMAATELPIFLVRDFVSQIKLQAEDEHKAVLETVKALEKKGYDVEFVDPDRSGIVNSEDILSKVREDTLLVSVMHVNNETGMIQPVEHIGKVLAEKKILFHVDATQSCGKLIDEIRTLNYNMLSFSAHKFQGPQGIGVLVLRKDGYRLPPIKGIMYGGQQEHGIRPGTIPVALVAGCGYACEIATQEYDHNKEKLDSLKKVVLKIFDESGIDYHFNGDQRHCVNSAVNICIPGVVSEALMIMAKQYCSISNGSACTSKNYFPSYVLKAMGIPEEEIECSVRISWGPDTSENELKKNLVKLIEIAKQIKG